ncbi:MAG TPA: ATP-binding protein [Kofleriaceae bacterium]|nr:ATP-binding protein [Kofleriaceae bacterium]
MLAWLLRPLRSLSARILLGFAVLTLAFGVITATLVVNMMLVEDQSILIGQGYMPAALASKDLQRSQEDLFELLKKMDPLSEDARRELARLRRRRDQPVGKVREVLDELGKKIDVDPKAFRGTRPTVEAIERGLAAVAPHYDQLLAGPPTAEGEAAIAAAASTAKQARTRILTEEDRLNRLALELAGRLTATVINTADYLERNERALRLRTITLGLIAVVLGLLLTVWVVIQLRPLRRLRDGARRVAAGDYASRIPERGPAEVADLAREFNSMGRAVEERERELVRSERLAAVGKMAAMIAHEVRNPLSSIGLNTELLEEELAGSPELDESRELCRAIHREVDRLTQITEEYLSFSRLPKPKLAHEPVNAMVGALAAFVREDLAAKQVTLTTELTPGDPVARIDAAQIRQCLLNLVRNAAEAVVAKGSGHVTLRTRTVPGRVEIAVEDTGIGIPPELLPQLFDPFFSTKEDGSGLGLALTQQIVRDHGGDLRVDSVVGRGTTFTVSVPVGG